MRLLIAEGRAVRLNYIWLPTWLGENLQFKKDVERRFHDEVVGKELTEELLDELHDKLIEYIVETYPVPGLFDYLDGLKFVEL